MKLLSNFNKSKEFLIPDRPKGKTETLSRNEIDPNN